MANTSRQIIVQTEVLCLKKKICTACGHRLAHRKWKETKQQPSMVSGPAVPGCCLVSFHFLWAILCPQAVLRPFSASLASCWAAEGRGEATKSIFQQLRSPLGNVGNGNNYLETDLRRFAFLFSFLQPFFGPVSIELSGSYTLLGSTSTLNSARNKIILDGIYRQVKKVNARLCEFGPEAARTPHHPT